MFKLKSLSITISDVPVSKARPIEFSISVRSWGVELGGL